MKLVQNRYVVFLWAALSWQRFKSIVDWLFNAQVVIGPEPSTNTAGRTQYINNTGGIAAIYGNATYKKEYSVNWDQVSWELSSL
jgi:hypothetical protein